MLLANLICGLQEAEVSQRYWGLPITSVLLAYDRLCRMRRRMSLTIDQAAPNIIDKSHDIYDTPFLVLHVDASIFTRATHIRYTYFHIQFFLCPYFLILKERARVPNLYQSHTPIMNERDPVPAYTSEPGEPDYPAHQHDLPRNHNLNLPPYQTPNLGPAIENEHDVISTFFTAISNRQNEVVTALLSAKLVTTATLDRQHRTPLVAATAAGNIHLVRDLVQIHNADVNAWSQYQGHQRTPLMVAATEGNLTLVKLFVDTYHADDALIAPDGQMALRLAVERGHADVVAFLPARRGGGWRRWKVQHAKALERAKTAWRFICRFFKVLGWYIPKFLIWDFPKEVVGGRLKRGAKWCWEHRKEFVPWCRRKVVEVPELLKKELQWMKRRIIECAKGLWIFLSVTLPRKCNDFVRWFWSTVTTRIPAALKAFGSWLTEGLKTLGKSLLAIASRIASFFHTIFTAVATFFAKLTLEDVMNGIRDVLKAMFLEFPAKCWSWVLTFGKVSYDVLEILLGTAGEIIWAIGRATLWLVLYVPKKIWVILSSLIASGAKGGHEVMVWIDPKN